MNGEKLVKKITLATDLPDELMESELCSLIKDAGYSPENITLDELRQIMTQYLQKVILNAKKEYS